MSEMIQSGVGVVHASEWIVALTFINECFSLFLISKTGICPCKSGLVQDVKGLSKGEKEAVPAGQEKTCGDGNQYSNGAYSMAAPIWAARLWSSSGVIDTW